METSIFEAIVTGDARVTLNVNAADLRDAVIAMAEVAMNKAEREARENRYKPALTPKEAAARIGCSTRTLRRLVVDGIITPAQLGRKMPRFSEAEIERALSTPPMRKYKLKQNA
ncbi:MAG: helix-turn-helix domain-containing protein [Bacteroidales bacterium]|nr:helix-turn-helix domain-containing protein [Bacteroidales bacterium]